MAAGGEEAGTPVTITDSQGVKVGDGPQYNQFFNVMPEPPRAPVWPILEGVVPETPRYFQENAEQAELFSVPTGSDTVVVTEVLIGMGGVGKTKRAAKFADAQWEQEKVDLLVWVNASSRFSIVHAYATVADRIGLVRLTGASDLTVAAKRFRSWLAENRDKKWLIVLDDVANPDDLESLKPPYSRDRGQTIITTRQADPAYDSRGWRLVEVELFTPAQAREYLRNRLSKHPEALDGADELAFDLGYLPLGLAAAAAYIAAAAGTPGLGGPRTCAAYSAGLRERRSDLSDMLRTKRIDEYGRTLAATWSISLERMESLERDDGQVPPGIARRLMELLPLLEPNGIPFAILNTAETRAYLGCRSANEVRQALQRLQIFSLLTESGAGDSDLVRMHALVQHAVRGTTEASPDATRVLANSILSLWLTHQRDKDATGPLQDNALALFKANPEPLIAGGIHELLFLLGESYGKAGLPVKAREYFTGLREQATAALGADTRDTLKTREREAYWLGFSGKAEAARGMFEELAADDTRVLGPDDRDTFIARHNAARFQGRSGDEAGAVGNLVPLVEAETRVLGATDHQTLESREILGYWRSKAGDHAGGIAELADLLPVLLEHYGLEDLLTLAARNDLALARAERGEYADAIAEGRPLVRDRERVFGPDDPATLSSRAYLAHWEALSEENAGNAAMRAAVLESIVGDHVRVLLPEHQNTLRARTYHIEALYLAERAAGGDGTRAIAAMEAHLAVAREMLGEHIITKRCAQKLREWRGES